MERLGPLKSSDFEMQRLSDLFVHSDASAAPVRVGIMVDDQQLIAVFGEIVADLRRSNFVEIALVIQKTAPKAPVTLPPRSFIGRLWKTVTRPHFFRDLGWEIYSRFDARYFPTTDNPVALVPCDGLLSDLPLLLVEPISKGFVHRISDDDIAKIRDAKLDVIVRFGFNILRGDILTVAKHGVWSFHHGDNDQYRGGPAHFWEIVEQNPVSGVILQVLTEELDAGRVLAKGLFATVPGVSLMRNRVQPYWGSVHMLIQKLWELHNFGWHHLVEHEVPKAPYTGKRKLYRRPTSVDVISWLLPVLVGKALRRLFPKGKIVEHWQFALRKAAGNMPHIPISMEGFTWIESPPGHFYADPFVFEHDGTHHLFLEDYSYAQKRAVIAHAPLSANGQVGTVRTIVDTGSHASYPCVFEDGDDIFMVPETIQDGGIRLYRAVNFPESWERCGTLMDGPFVDSTVFRDQQLWWMFSTVREPRGRGLALCLFWAEKVQGPWHSHPLNPLSVDIRDARGAGQVLRDERGLIRPSQDCAGKYGRAFAFHRILELSRTAYKEERIQVVDPTWHTDLVTTHTYNRNSAFEVTDGQVTRGANVLG
jgi:hypothetical protein